MKRLLYTCIILVLPATIYAQPVIHNMLEYIAGNSLRYHNCDVGSYGPGAAGANMAWNFSTLQTTDTIKQYIVAPSATPYAAVFPLAAFAIKSYDGIVHHPTYDFIKRNIFTGHIDKQLLGSADSFNSFTVTYPDNVLRLRTPFAYLDSANDDYTVSYGNVSGSGHAVIKADAYGTLQLPAFTYSNVLRVKTTYDERDTTFAGPAFFVTHLQGFRYEWFDDAHRSPLLTWDSTSITSQGGNAENKRVFYLAQENTTGITHVDNQSLQITASLHNNLLAVNGRFDKGREYFLNLYSIDGRLIFQASFIATGNSWKTSIDKELSDGIYLLSITDRDGSMGVVKLPQN